MKTNFDNYLDKQVKDPAFARRFRQAGEAWDVSRMNRKQREKGSPGKPPYEIKGCMKRN